ncbi:ATP-binding cassette domain-containing protein [Candidatus Poribacteria bacterium]|nr:ATP-binding cassette domain-containing protein [Candidatus Poribacteria bacterium]
MHILKGKQIEALKGINLHLNMGEAIGLMGKSGSGKSTLMKCIYRTYLPTSGHIYYYPDNNGRLDIVSADEHAILKIRREDITYCSQFLQVIPRIPAIEVVTSKLTAKGEDADKAVSLTQEYFKRLNLVEELWDAYPSTFSGGEQQRINIAQAIIARPRILLVDEPTASLDPATKDSVIDMILELKAKGTSVVCITHDFYTLNKLSDRVFRMESRDFVSKDQIKLESH